MKTHYKTDPDKQKRYEKMVKKITKTVKDRYGKGFDDAVHPDMIEQYVRSIIRAEEYEESLDNGTAEKDTYSNLKAERSVQKDLVDRLKLTVRGIVGDTRSFTTEKPEDITEFLEKQFAPFVKDDDEEDDEDEADNDNIQQE